MSKNSEKFKELDKQFQIIINEVIKNKDYTKQKMLLEIAKGLEDLMEELAIATDKEIAN